MLHDSAAQLLEELGQTPSVLAEDDLHDAAVQRALKLLPKRPEKVVLLDYEKASPAMRDKLSRVEGFVTTGEPTVYLKKQGSALQQAARGPGASRQEEELWKTFIVSQKVDPRRGLAYLDLLRKRRAPASGTTAGSRPTDPASPR